jgi:uncharacterized protein YjbJ (UPF0337 family)
MHADNVKNQGRLEQIGGRFKQMFGRIFGDERTRAEGRADELRGRAEVTSQEATTEQREGERQTSGASIRQDVGDAISHERIAAEGRVKELEGREQQQDVHR